MQGRARPEAAPLCTALCAVLLALVAPACSAPQRTDLLFWRQQILAGGDEVKAITGSLVAERAALTKAVIEIIEDVDLQRERPHAVEAAMLVAGELQLTDCIPVLAESIQFWADPPSGVLPERIEWYPAGMALIHMGFAAVPALVGLLPSDDLGSGILASMALNKMQQKPLILDLMVAARDRTEDPVKRERLDLCVKIMQSSIKEDQWRGIPQQ